MGERTFVESVRLKWLRETYFLEKESRTKDLLFQSVLSYAKMNEVREMLKHETFKGNCTVFFTKEEHYHTKETDYVKINCN